MSVNRAFETFAKEAPEQQAAWMDAARKLGSASILDEKTRKLAYIAEIGRAHV